MKRTTRRRFIEDSILAAAAVAAPWPVLAQETKSGSPNNRLRVAVIGCGIRGKQHVQELSHVHDCEIVYVCDPDQDRVTELAAAVAKQQGSAPKAVRDMRKIFDDRSVDAVFIAAPN